MESNSKNQHLELIPVAFLLLVATGSAWAMVIFSSIGLIAMMFILPKESRKAGLWCAGISAVVAAVMVVAIQWGMW